MNEKEKKSIEIVKKIKNMKFNVTSSFYSSGTISLSIEEKEAIETVLKLISKLKKENKEKDKQIDLMAKFIRTNISYDKIIYETCINGKCNNEECHEDDLKECIKQYFERKATNDS